MQKLKILTMIFNMTLPLAGIVYTSDALGETGQEEHQAFFDDDSEIHATPSLHDEDDTVKDQEEEHDSGETKDNDHGEIDSENEDDSAHEQDQEELESKSTDNKITICHIPPENPGNAHTMVVDETAWEEHKAHHDTIGTCKLPVNIIVGCKEGAEDKEKYHRKLARAVENYFTPIVIRESALQDPETKSAYQACLDPEKGKGLEIEGDEQDDHEDQNTITDTDHQDETTEAENQTSEEVDNESEAPEQDEIHVIANCKNSNALEDDLDDVSEDEHEFRSHLRSKQHEDEQKRPENERAITVSDDDLEDEDVKHAYESCLDPDKGHGTEIEHFRYPHGKTIHVIVGCEEDEEHAYHSKLINSIQLAREEDSDERKGSHLNENTVIVLDDTSMNEPAIHAAAESCLKPDEGRAMLIRVESPNKNTIPEIMDIAMKQNALTKLIQRKPSSQGIDGRIGWREVVGP